MKLIAAYTALLNSIGYESTDEGIRDIEHGNYVYIDGERLYMPERKWLERSDSMEKLYFHPMSENIVESGKSPVFEWLENCIIYRTNLLSVSMMTEMVGILANENKIAKIPPKLNSFAEACKNSDTQRVTFLSKILDQIVNDISEYPIYEFRYRRRFEVDNVTYHRVCLINESISMHFDSPSYDDKNKPKVLGVRASTKDKDLDFARAFIGWWFGDGGMPRKITSTSNSNDAPYFYSLINAWAEWSDKFNVLVNKFKKFLKDDEGSSYASSYMIDRSFSEIDWTIHVKDIPPTRGNTGVTPGNRKSEGVRPAEPHTEPHRPTLTAPTAAEPKDEGLIKPSELLEKQRANDVNRLINENLANSQRSMTTDQLSRILGGGMGSGMGGVQPSGFMPMPNPALGNPFMQEAARRNAVNAQNQFNNMNPLNAITQGFNTGYPQTYNNGQHVTYGNPSMPGYGPMPGQGTV